MSMQAPKHPPEFVQGALKIATEGEHEERKIAIESLNAYGSAAIKAAFLLNGGAILALLALLGAVVGKDPVKPLLDAKLLIKAMLPAFHFFSAGVCAAAFVSGIGYVNWSVRVRQHWEPGHWYALVVRGKTWTPPKRIGLTIEITRVLAVAFYIGSLLCFIRGVWIVGNAFRKVTL